MGHNIYLVPVCRWVRSEGGEKEKESRIMYASHLVDDAATTEKEKMGRSTCGSDGSKSRTLLSSLSLAIPIRQPRSVGSRQVAVT